MRYVRSLILVAALVLCIVPTARADGPAPLFELFADPAVEGSAGAPYPPGSGFEGPCGVAVDPKGAFYVADYYHHAVDAFSAARNYLTQLASVSPGDGPCALAVDAAGRLYVNEYHQGVVRYTPAAFPLTAGASYGSPTVIDPGPATGIALDRATGILYVDHRTHISAYEASGAPVLDEGGEELRIGAGTLLDGYGLAVSEAPAAPGRLFVADDAADVVKVYDPALDTVAPVQTIAGDQLPGGGFVSLRDSALAFDRANGFLYVADLLQPEGFERPEAVVRAFKAGGEYLGRLSRNVVDARPPGLAVDNSTGATQGRIYVTSGNSEDARLYAYAPGSATTLPGSCAPGGACPGGSAEGAGPVVFSALPDLDGRPSTATAAAGSGGPTAAASEAATIVQKGTLRVSLNGSLSPRKLPRGGRAPIAVSVSGRVTTTDQSPPPQLQGLRIELNRHGHLDYEGLPTCPYHLIQPASSTRALRACRSALVGQGRFEADISLSGQEPYQTGGKLLVFNGVRHGKPVLFGQIYAPRPFATSFVIVFALGRVSHGTYGTSLTASLPKALGNWGNLTGIEMRLSRRFRYQGERHSFLSSGCPAPAALPGAVFSLARASFRFAGAGKLTSTLTRSCQVR
ncbi:MAG TPA: NHL repeat-containing protein [Solirubrobacterales bacterium]|nr:NHL repeat-containing protein [Solirubrobacterales bacterium]